MSDRIDTRYDAREYEQAARIAAHLAQTGYDLSASERSALRQAAAVLHSWAGVLPREPAPPAPRDARF
jgi:hypothetical protein